MRSFLQVLLVCSLAVLAIFVSEGSCAYEPKGNEESTDGKCYFSFKPKWTTWYEASENCARENRILAVFTNDARLEWIEKYLRSKGAKGQVWMGGRKNDNTWNWLGGFGKIPTRGNDWWEPGNPSGDGECVYMLVNSGRINDAYCYDNLFPSLCMDKECSEKDKKP